MFKKKLVVNVGDVIKDRYEVVKQLGQGGFGAVFEAKDKKTGEVCALKVYKDIDFVCLYILLQSFHFFSMDRTRLTQTG